MRELCAWCIKASTRLLRYDKAEPLYLRAVATWQQTLGPHDAALATCLHNLAELYRAQSHYTQAEPLARQALAMRERLFGPDHADVATSLNTLALLYVAQPRYGKAEPLYVRTVATGEQTLGPDHAGMAVVLESYAALLRHTQRDMRAFTIQARAKAIRARYAQQSSPQ